MSHSDHLTIPDLMRALVQALEDQASRCSSESDLKEAVSKVRWLNTIASRALGSAVMSYALGGEIPGPPAGSHAKRASLLLETEEVVDPELSDSMLQALRLQRSTQWACSNLIAQIEATTETGAGKQ